MPLVNPPIIIKADIRIEKLIKKPIVTQNDSVIFQIEVYENGVPYDLTGATTVSLASKRKVDSVTVVTNGTFLNNIATFELGSNELEKAGEVFAKAQFYDAEDRLSTLTFSYMVQSDPTGAGFVPSVVEQTLIQSYFTDAQAKIDELSAVNVVALSASLDETNLALAEKVEKVNGVLPDVDGNVNIIIPEVDTTNLATKSELQQVSLAYKESYATLTALQTAYPTGNAYNHAVLADGLIYTYTTSWVSTGLQANGTGIANGSVTVEKLNKGVPTTVFTNNILDFDISARSLKLNRTNGVVTSIEEKQATTMVKLTTLIYDVNGILTNIEEVAGGQKVISTINRASGNVVSITKGVSAVV